MKVLVTGATGNVGRYVVNELLALGQEVVAGDIDISKIKSVFGDKVEAARLDFTDKSTFDTAFKGINRVFLMRPPHLGKPEDLFPFIDSMKAHQIKLVSFLSLMGVENNTIPPHHKIEKYIEQVGVPYAHIRPGFFMQNLSGIHAFEIKERQEIFVPAGKSKTSFIDAADIGLSIATLLASPEKYINTAHTITGPEALDYYQIAKILSDVLGKKITYKRPGYLRYRSEYIKKRGLDKEYVNVTVALYFMTRMGTAKAVTQGFNELTGKQPRNFREFAIANKEAFIK